MKEDQDQINAEIARLEYTDHKTDIIWAENRSWLSQDVVWPNSNYIDTHDTWPPQCPGWVRQITKAEELVECLNAPFYYNSVSKSYRYNTAELISTALVDNKPDNNKFTLEIEIGG
jgi:hypothetical protein